MNKSMILSLIVRSRLHSALCGFSETKCAVVVALTIFGLLVSADTTFAASCPAPNPDYGTGTVTINAAAGTYRVWSRIMAGNASTDDSYSLDVDSANCYTVGDSGISVGTWTWIDYVDGNTTSKLNVTLSAGEHVLKMVGREAGVKIDRIIITTDMACIPSGTGDNCVSIDVTPPISPTNLSANATGSSSITVSWTAATDNIGVTSYQVERCQGSSCSSFIQVGTPSSSPFVDSGLTTSTSYSYHVRAVDAAGNTSAWSNVVGATTQAQSSTVTLGETSILPSGDSGNGNLLLAQQATLSQPGTLQSLSFYVTTASGNLRLGVYDAAGPSGGPGTLKAQTNSFTPTTGWNTQNVTTPIALTTGTYWLAYLPSSNSLAFSTSNTGSFKYYSYTFGTLPTTFSTTPSSGTGHWSLYATLSQPANTTPQACSTVTPTNFTTSTYTGYGAPYDVFASNTPLISTTCTASDLHTINTTFGITGDTTRIVYTKGYYYDSNISDWTSFTGTCTGALNGDWCQGSVSASVTNANISTASATDPAYVVGFTCSVQGGQWKCGCRDATCANFYWQIQGAGM